MSVIFKEGYATAVTILQTLVNAITTGADNTAASDVWKLEYPAKADTVTDYAIISRDLGQDSSGTELGSVYIELNQPKTYSFTPRFKPSEEPTERNNYYFINCKIGTKWKSGISTEPGTENYVDLTDPEQRPNAWPKDEEGDRVNDSEYARFSWFMSDTESTIKSWLPVQYWVSITPDSISIILSGDASASFTDRLISFGYFGKVNAFTDPCSGEVLTGQHVDPSSNFGMCVSSDIAPTYSTRYSDKTGTGVSDIVMLKTATGFPFQAHHVAFTTPDEFVDKALEGPSAWTKKYHMSPAYVFHGYDGYRGEMNGILVTDRSAIVHLDDMIVDKGKSTQKIYKAFMVNAPFSIFNTSPNVLYSVALLKSEGLS